MTDHVSPSLLLAKVVDRYVRWFGRWHHAAFFTRDRSDAGVEAALAFAEWCQALWAADLTHQPLVDRIAQLHGQMHRLAEDLLNRVVDGEPIDASAHVTLVEQFDEFMYLLRRMERAFNVAASGIDPLTGLRTRQGLLDELRRELDRFTRRGSPFCVALCDVDRFKSVNDTYGHETGDRVLAAVAGTISAGIRSFDDAYRMGGEEFLICLKNTNLDEALTVLDRLRREIESTHIALPQGGSLRVTASFGVTEVTPGISVDQLILDADRALYAAKHGGRNQVKVAA